MSFIRFVLFVLFAAGITIHADAQRNAPAAKQNSVLEKVNQEVQGQINVAKKALGDSIPQKNVISPIKDDSIKLKASNEIKTISENQKRELKKTSVQAKQEIKKLAQTPKSILNDTVPASKRINIPEADGLNATYENGKLVLPDDMKNVKDLNKVLPGLSDVKPDKTSLPKNVLPTDLPSEKSIPKVNNKLPDVSNLNQENLTEKALTNSEGLVQNNASYQAIRDQTDSIRNVVEKGKEIVDMINGGVPDISHIYSSKTLKKLYDSLGISKIDSVMALAATQEEVSKEELLQQINASFPSSSTNQPMTDVPEFSKPSDLKSLESSIPASELPNTSGLGSLKDQATGLSSMKDQVPANLSDMKLSMNDLKELAPLRGFQLPTDSIPVLDSLRKLDLSKEKIKLEQDEIEDNVESALIKQKSSFWDKAYVDAIVSFADNKDVHSFQVSPSFGYRVTNDLSFGIGPNILIKEKHNSWNIAMGFRTFSKYEIFSQRAYLQIEDMVDPASISEEYISQTRHSILTGAGVLLPITKTIALNFCILYRVNNDAYSSGQNSPWVMRLGLSSKKKTKKETLK